MRRFNRYLQDDLNHEQEETFIVGYADDRRQLAPTPSQATAAADGPARPQAALPKHLLPPAGALLGSWDAAQQPQHADYSRLLHDLHQLSQMPPAAPFRPPHPPAAAAAAAPAMSPAAVAPVPGALGGVGVGMEDLLLDTPPSQDPAATQLNITAQQVAAGAAVTAQQQRLGLLLGGAVQRAPQAGASQAFPPQSQQQQQQQPRQQAPWGAGANTTGAANRKGKRSSTSSSILYSAPQPSKKLKGQRFVIKEDAPGQATAAAAATAPLQAAPGVEQPRLPGGVPPAAPAGRGLQQPQAAGGFTGVLGALPAALEPLPQQQQQQQQQPPGTPAGPPAGPQDGAAAAAGGRGGGGGDGGEHGTPGLLRTPVTDGWSGQTPAKQTAAAAAGQDHPMVAPPVAAAHTGGPSGISGVPGLPVLQQLLGVPPMSALHTPAPCLKAPKTIARSKADAARSAHGAGGGGGRGWSVHAEDPGSSIPAPCFTPDTTAAEQRGLAGAGTHTGNTPAAGAAAATAAAGDGLQQPATALQRLSVQKQLHQQLLAALPAPGPSTMPHAWGKHRRGGGGGGAAAGLAGRLQQLLQQQARSEQQQGPGGGTQAPRTGDTPAAGTSGDAPLELVLVSRSREAHLIKATCSRQPDGGGEQLVVLVPSKAVDLDLVPGVRIRVGVPWYHVDMSAGTVVLATSISSCQ